MRSGDNVERDMEKTFLVIGAVLGALAVAIGAFGAHGLKALVTADLLANFETGARYHMYHALAIVAVALVIARHPAAPLAPVAGWLFLAGIVIFSGSLYLMALTGMRWLGAITPIGGVLLIGGWVCLALGAARA
jgi:uncharacterized membrane protein YgdD (TMEM256/DUF423 family)